MRLAPERARMMARNARKTRVKTDLALSLQLVPDPPHVLDEARCGSELFPEVQHVDVHGPLGYDLVVPPEEIENRFPGKSPPSSCSEDLENPELHGRDVHPLALDGHFVPPQIDDQQIAYLDLLLLTGLRLGPSEDRLDASHEFPLGKKAW